MRCRKAREYVSRSVDGDLDGRRATRLERHLAACDDCRAFAADLKAIVGGAADLAAPEPSEKVWRNVRAGLEAGTVRPSAEGASLDRRPLFGLSLPAARYAGAAALALLLVVAGVAVGRRWGRQETRAADAPGLADGAMWTLAKLDEAERHYQQAIASLSEAFAAGKDALPPEVAELFDRNLSVIDATIRACRAAVLDEPDDLEARDYLLAAYTKKITLLDAVLDLQKGDRDAAAGKTII